MAALISLIPLGCGAGRDHLMSIGVAVPSQQLQDRGPRRDDAAQHSVGAEDGGGDDRWTVV